MAIEYTFSIIKPDATTSNKIGAINQLLEQAGLQIVAQKMQILHEKDVKNFYFEHKDRPFFQSLVQYMISGPVVLQVLKGENAIKVNREVMGATNPKDAAEGTIRALYGQSIEANAVHGSDSPESAVKEIAIFFSQTEIVG